MPKPPTDDAYRLEVVADGDAMSQRAAEVVADAVAAKPDLVLAMPTGSTPVGLFRRLAARAEAGEVDFSRVRLVTLDEYVGLPEGDPNRLVVWLRDVFAGPVGIADDRILAVPADAPDPVAAAARFEADLAVLGGLDLAVLGIGANGHIAYNAPPAAVNSRTRVVPLAVSSVAGAAQAWHPTCPVGTHAMTVGVGTLLGAKRIVLIASGAGKAEIVRRALMDPMSEDVPASWLGRAGDRLTVILDRGAAARLSH